MLLDGCQRNRGTYKILIAMHIINNYYGHYFAKYFQAIITYAKNWAHHSTFRVVLRPSSILPILCYSRHYKPIRVMGLIFVRSRFPLGAHALKTIRQEGQESKMCINLCHNTKHNVLLKRRQSQYFAKEIITRVDIAHEWCWMHSHVVCLLGCLYFFTCAILLPNLLS